MASHKQVLDKYTDWEQEVLQNLINSGPEGSDIAEYIVKTNMKIGFRWHPYAGAVYDVEDNAVYINADPDDTRSDDPFIINIIAHETKHLQQGPSLASTKIGEIEAWKTGDLVENGINPFKPGSVEYQMMNIDLSDPNVIENGTKLIHEYNKNAGISGILYNFFYSFLRDYPKENN